MFIRCELTILILALTLDGQVHTTIGGHEAAPHSRPYMAILEGIRHDGSVAQICGGFLLSEDFVMSAAHCNPSTVLLGVHNYRNISGQQRIQVEEKFRHKDFEEHELKNDIMLLKLKSKANFTENVKPIKLAWQNDGSLPVSCTVAGWGNTDMDKKFLSSVLMEANVTLTDNELCLKDTLYCSEGETGPYPGDAGGPLVCENGKAYGVVSGRKGKLNIYTKIAEYICWIESVMTCHHD